MPDAQHHERRDRPISAKESHPDDLMRLFQSYRLRNDSSRAFLSQFHINPSEGSTGSALKPGET